MSELPDPLTPAECDLRDFQFMPLDVGRLRDSDLSALETPEACWAAVLLWGASWHQVPAASLPNDDRVLAQLAGYGRVVREWLRVKDRALRGFVLCGDGRLYHPVVAEKAIEAWRGKLEQRWRTECARIKKHNQRTGEDKPFPTFEEFLAALVPGFVPEDKRRTSPGPDGECPRGQNALSPPRPSGNAIQGTGRGTGNNTEPDGSGADAPSGRSDDDEALDPLEGLRSMPVAKGSWRLAVKVLVDQGRMTDPKARTFIGKLKSGGLTDDELWQIAEAAFGEQTQDPQAYLVKAAQGVVERRNATPPAYGPRLRNPPEMQQRAWMRDWVTGEFEWKEADRGSPPGKPGCQVSPEIQREFGIEPAKPQPVGAAA